jgi:hypothetical protein
MTTIENWREERISKTKEITFHHNKNTVDCVLWDEENEHFCKIKDVDADIFLAHFDYGQGMSDDKNQIDVFLNEVL